MAESGSTKGGLGVWLVAGIVACLILGLGVVVVGWRMSQGSSTDGAAANSVGFGSDASAEGAYTFERLPHPARTLVRDKNGAVLAVFTDGARTVRLTGPSRRFAEPEFTKATVTTDAWVRLAPRAWHEGAQKEAWFPAWLRDARRDASPDVLAVAMDYLTDAPDKVDKKGVRFAGDADFGPESERDRDGRAENSDFNDYLGVRWSFPDAGDVDAKPDRYGFVDCSGYLRLVYGYRMGYPMRKENTPGVGLPRRAFAMSKFGPGVEVIPNRDRPARDYDVLQPGDFVFFDLDAADGSQIDHSGIFVGVDNRGHYRFVSSRTKANGPTMGDAGYAAILDGGGHFSVTFRNARRL
jgi:cell wall-associated NlpC family hydrolase